MCLWLSTFKILAFQNDKIYIFLIIFTVVNRVSDMKPQGILDVFSYFKVVFTVLLIQTRIRNK